MFPHFATKTRRTSLLCYCFQGTVWLGLVRSSNTSKIVEELQQQELQKQCNNNSCRWPLLRTTTTSTANTPTPTAETSTASTGTNKECSYIHTSAKTKDCNNAILNNASTFHRKPFLDKLGAAGKTAVVEHYEMESILRQQHLRE